MGRWTPEYRDHVLRDKFKGLINGAIKRAALEKRETTISYEQFVTDLDEGDSFTTTIIDILVNEMAERQKRPNPSDRHLISENTAKSLRMQSAPPHIYRGRTGRHRRLNPPEFIHNALDLSTSEEEDEINLFEDSHADSSRVLAYLNGMASLDPLGTNSSTAGPSTSAAEPNRDLINSPRPTSNNPWAADNPSRRAARSRTTDFTEFASRRRSIIRQSAEHRTEPSRPDDSADGTWRFASLLDRPSREPTPQEIWANQTTSQRATARRLFPLTALNHWGFTNESGNNREEDPRERSPVRSSSADRLPSTDQPSSSQLWYSLTAGAQSASSRRASMPGRANPDTERMSVLAPRLRRGGLRAPEALLRRHNSTISMEEPEVISTHDGTQDAYTVSSSTQPAAVAVGGQTESELQHSVPAERSGDNIRERRDRVVQYLSEMIVGSDAL